MSQVNVHVPEDAVVRAAYIAVYGDPKETSIVRQLHLPVGRV